MKQILFVILVLFFGGCSYINAVPSDSGIHTNKEGMQMHWGKVPIHVWYDGDLEKKVVEQATLALEHINALVGTTIFLKPQKWPGFVAPDSAPKGTVLLTKGYGFKGCVVAETKKKFMSKSYRITSANVIFYGNEVNSKETFITAVHEFGHVLGLAHDFDKFSIMNPKIYSAPLDKKHLTEKDIALLRKQYL